MHKRKSLMDLTTGILIAVGIGLILLSVIRSFSPSKGKYSSSRPVIVTLKRSTIQPLEEEKPIAAVSPSTFTKISEKESVTNRIINLKPGSGIRGVSSHDRIDRLESSLDPVDATIKELSELRSAQERIEIVQTLSERRNLSFQSISYVARSQIFDCVKGKVRCTINDKEKIFEIFADAKIQADVREGRSEDDFSAEIFADLITLIDNTKNLTERNRLIDRFQLAYPSIGDLSEIYPDRLPSTADQTVDSDLFKKILNNEI